MSECFDKSALLDRVDGDIEFLEETIEMLDEDSGEILEQIQNAASNRDAESLTHSAHSFKGMLSNFCADRAVNYAKDIEMMGRQGDLTGVEDKIQLLLNEVLMLKKELQIFLQENKA